jgi:biopolymer transport protein ExbD
MGEDGGEWGPSKRGGSEADLDITPMIDVTFLLLIFFMVTSTMKPPATLDVPPAKHGLGVETGGAMVVTIKKPVGNGSPTIEFEREVKTDAGIGKVKTDEATLDQVRQYVREENSENKKTQVIIKADREVPHGFVQEVTRAVLEVEGVTFSIGVRDKQ